MARWTRILCLGVLQMVVSLVEKQLFFHCRHVCDLLGVCPPSQAAIYLVLQMVIFPGMKKMYILVIN